MDNSTPRSPKTGSTPSTKPRKSGTEGRPGSPIAPASFYGAQSQSLKPPLPKRPSSSALGSTNTHVWQEPFREPELVEDTPALAPAAGLDVQYDPTSSWPAQDTSWDAFAPGGGLFEQAGTIGWGTDVAAKVGIDGRAEAEETRWWDPAVRDARPGPGILGPLLAQRVHSAEHTLYHVVAAPPDVRAPDGTPPFVPPGADEVRTAVPHPNAYYCRRHNGWVLLSWRFSSLPPPVARSFTGELPDQEHRRRSACCVGDAERGVRTVDRAHHFHYYPHAVDARKLDIPFVRSEWEDVESRKRRRRKMTLDLGDAPMDLEALKDAKEEDVEMEEEEEGELLDLYVCCQCQLYCVVSDVHPGVIPVKYVEDLTKDKGEHPPPGKSGEHMVMTAWETILTIIENRLWKGETRQLPVSRKAFQTKLGWNPTLQAIFTALDFKLEKDHGSEDVSLRPPNVDPSRPEGKRIRGKLLRAWVEISAWLADYQKRFAPALKDFRPHPLWVQIESAREKYQSKFHALPDQTRQVDYLPPGLAGTERMNEWELLGMTPASYSWENLAFAYYAQCRCDPAHTMEYFSALFTLFTLMKDDAPQELQDLILQERTRNRFTRDNLAEAVKVLGFGHDARLGVDFDNEIPEDFIVNAWRDVIKSTWNDVANGTAKWREANDALRTVAEARGSAELLKLWEKEQNGGMTPERAYQTLEVPKDVDDAMLITIFAMRLEDQPSQMDKMREALSVIAEFRDSGRLREFLNTGADPGDIVTPTRPDWPRGLNQLGNTCYLNSLLQYFYTIRDLRDAVEPLLNASLKTLDDDKLTDDDLKRHRVGGRLVTRREIMRSKKFVSQLADLFWHMEHCETPSVTPTVELAKLALVTSKDEEEDDVDRSGTDSSNDTDATLVEDTPMHTAVASPIEGSSSVLGKRVRDPDRRDVDMDVDTQVGDTDKENFVMVGDPASPQKASFGSPGNGSPGKERSPEKKDMDVDAPVSTDAGKEVASKSAAPARKSAESVMMFGRQHDVSECMDNCMFQIETALLRFDGMDGTEEGKTSIVKRLFYGTLKQRLTMIQDDSGSRPSVHEKEDLFSLLPVNVSDEGYDLYDGLSRYFDDVVEFESKKARMEVTLVDLPPVLQIQLQRAQFDRETMQPYKSQAYVKFGETLYMDRFLDSANPEKKERSKAIHSELSAIRDRIHLLTTGKHAPFGPALTSTHEFLQKQEAVDLPEVDDEFILLLNSEQDYLRIELEELRSRASKLKEELDGIWENEREAAYELTSVFIHRGSSPSWGHYFFYSRHLPENPDSWFKYNDSDVSVVSKDEVLADTTGSTANPYMLVFVRKGSEMINTVKRFDITALEDS